MDIEQLEIELLFEALNRRYGYDFRDYSYETARRRVLQRVAMFNLATIGELQHLILHDTNAANALVRSLSINVTEMFRDPDFFMAVRKTILPCLTEQEHLKIWHAGCASGEEVYSMAILLKEEGLHGHTRLYGTDFNDTILEKAKVGLMPLGQMQQNIHNYQSSGGNQDFADYYHARYEGAIINNSLKKNIVFSRHNLTCDRAFGIFHMIVCRNVLIYFNQRLKDRVLQLFVDSLRVGGYLCLGSHETLMPNWQREAFQVVDSDLRIYQKMETL